MVTYITPSITIGVHSIVLPVRPSSSPRVVRPGRLEPRHVVAVDLIQRGIPHATGVVPHARPVDVAIRLSRDVCNDSQQPNHCDQARAGQCGAAGSWMVPRKLGTTHRSVIT